MRECHVITPLSSLRAATAHLTQPAMRLQDESVRLRFLPLHSCFFFAAMILRHDIRIRYCFCRLRQRYFEDAARLLPFIMFHAAPSKNSWRHISRTFAAMPFTPIVSRHAATRVLPRRHFRDIFHARRRQAALRRLRHFSPPRAQQMSRFQSEATCA